MPNHFINHNPHKESGVVLITGMIFLMILTMLVLSALRSGTLEERMASNSRNRQVALQAAEAILRDAENQLFSGSEYKSKFDSGNGTTLANGFYSAPVAGCTPRWKKHDPITGCPIAIDWSSSTATLTFASPANWNLYGMASAPKYIVEIISPPSRLNSTVSCSKGLATVTAQGMGPDSSIVYIQTMYRYQSDRLSDGC